MCVKLVINKNYQFNLYQKIIIYRNQAVNLINLLNKPKLNMRKNCIKIISAVSHESIHAYLRERSTAMGLLLSCDMCAVANRLLQHLIGNIHGRYTNLENTVYFYTIDMMIHLLHKLLIN